jgi:hypothetical protein
MPASAAADGGHDRALGAARNVGLEAGFPDALDDVLNLFFGRAVGHIYDHGGYPFGSISKTKAAILNRGFEWNI